MSVAVIHRGENLLEKASSFCLFNLRMDTRGNSPEGWSTCRAGKGRFDLARSQNVPGCKEKITACL